MSHPRLLSGKGKLMTMMVCTNDDDDDDDDGDDDDDDDDDGDGDGEILKMTTLYLHATQGGPGGIQGGVQRSANWTRAC